MKIYCAEHYWAGEGKFYLPGNSAQMLYLLTFTEAANVCDSTVILETIPSVIFESDTFLNVDHILSLTVGD